uniref:Uncharacterized protein n=1 Tax=Sphaerodactylus townsendi TaxID=933632 RepID=A0ACB8GEE5_9SAUR
MKFLDVNLAPLVTLVLRALLVSTVSQEKGERKVKEAKVVSPVMYQSFLDHRVPKDSQGNQAFQDRQELKGTGVLLDLMAYLEWQVLLEYLDYLEAQELKENPEMFSLTLI